MTDYTTLSKQEWLSMARSFYQHLLDVLSGLSEKDWKRSTRYLGWDCKDLVNHMTSAITINFNLLVQMALDGDPVPAPGFNLFLRNAQEVARRRTRTVNETIEEFDIEISKLLNRLDDLSEAQWHSPAFFFIGDVDISTLFLVQLADNVVHERDLLTAANRWNGFNVSYTAPLVDWFMRVFRPASFRPEKAIGGSALIQYTITGDIGGSWVMEIKNNRCHVVPGILEQPEIEVTVAAEDLITMALARSSPLVGKLARSVEWIVPGKKREDFAAKVTGIAAAADALFSGKVKIKGDKKKAKQVVQKWFWHFWERTEQTETNILHSKYRLSDAVASS